MRVFLKFHWHVQLTFGVKPMPQQVLIEIATGPRELQWSNYPRVCVFVCVVCLCFFNLCTANKIIKFGSRFQYEQKNCNNSHGYAGLRGEPSGRDVGNLRLPVARCR